jgi:hypothetical protein
MEATCSFETSVDFQCTTQCYIPEDRTLQDVEVFFSLFSKEASSGRCLCTCAQDLKSAASMLIQVEIWYAFLHLVVAIYAVA